MNLVDKAEKFATDAHSSTKQLRKYSGKPFITHPQNVVRILSDYTKDSEILAAAWLHDVMEDISVSELTLRELFGERITKIVKELTSFTKVEIPDRETRKKAENLKIKNISTEAKLIKLADILDNTWDVRENDPIFATTYLNEKLIQLDLLKDVNTELWTKVHKQIVSELSLLRAIV
jgi:(p)ppGpp synthase/HD superfamily hydrolase